MNLSRRLWWGILGSVTAAVLLTSGISFFAAKTYLINEVDKELEQRTKRIAKYPWFPMRYMRGRHRRNVENFHLLINDPGGKEIFKSEAWLEDFPVQLTNDSQAIDIISKDQRYFRLIQLPVNLDPEWQKHIADRQKENKEEKKEDERGGRDHDFKPIDPKSKVLMAAEYTGLRGDLNSLRNLLIIVASAVLVSALFIAKKLRDGLISPVQNLVKEIDDLHTHDVDARIELEKQPEEIEQISSTLNGLLSRLADNRKRERRTIGDIAHELRTPLAAVRSELEFASNAGDIPAERSQFLTEQINALQQRVDSLLLLMRLESHQEDLHIQEISIAELVSDAWAQFPSSNRALEITGDESAELHCDQRLMAMVFENIFSNIQSYAHGDGAVHVSLTEAADHILLRISNPASNLDPGHYDQAFSPFWRHDLARNQSESHHGLGLAIVERIITLHQAQARASVDDAHLFHLEISWPKTSASDER